MKIRRVPSTNLRLDHEQLNDLLERCEAPGPGAVVRIGIRNHFGDLCTVVEAEGPQEALNVVSCLEGRDMVDELTDEAPHEKFESIFRDRKAFVGR